MKQKLSNVDKKCNTTFCALNADKADMNKYIVKAIITINKVKKNFLENKSLKPSHIAMKGFLFL